MHTICLSGQKTVITKQHFHHTSEAWQTADRARILLRSSYHLVLGAVRLEPVKNMQENKLSKQEKWQLVVSIFLLYIISHPAASL